MKKMNCYFKKYDKEALLKNTMKHIIMIFVIVLVMMVVRDVVQSDKDKSTEYKAISRYSYKVDISSIKYYDSVTTMKKQNLTAGTICKTEGYYTSGDNGGAYYVISSSIGNVKKVDDFLAHKLDNGLYANMAILSDEINVMTAGIKTDIKAAALINKVSNSCVESGKIKKLIFNSGRYYIETPVDLRSLSYVGNGVVEWFVASDFKTTADMVLRTANYFEGYSTNFSMKNINVTLEVSRNYNLYGTETIMLAVLGTDSCTLENCDFVARQASYNGAYSPVDLVVLKEGNIRNVNITGCVFKNETSKTEGGYVVGGCLWIWGGWQKYNNVIENIMVDNCEFVHTANDEVVCIWGCSGNNVVINNSKFTVKNHQSDNVISIYDMYYEDFAIKNCVFNIESMAMRIIKSTENRYSDLDVDGCTFYLKNNKNDIYNENISVFYAKNDRSSWESKSTALARTNYTISNCNVYTNDTTKYRSFITAYNCKIDIDNCNFNGNIPYLIWIENCFDDILLKNSYINLKNSEAIYLLKNTTDVCDVSLTGNYVVEKITLFIQGQFATNYVVKNNVLEATKFDYGIETYGTVLSGKKNSIAVSGNRVINTNNYRHSNISYNNLVKMFNF